MAKNEGKKFEEDFKKSVPKWCWCYRFKDGTANFRGTKNENVRFQAHNICDFMVMTNNKLFLLELKSHKGSSIPFNCIREKQIEEMSSIKHQNIVPLFIFNFRDKEKTYAVQAMKVKEFIENADRKSISIAWCKESGIKIIGKRKVTRFRYDLENLFRN